MLVLPHDAFYGDLHLTRALPGITFSHRVANSAAEQVEVHTHVDAHLVLVTSGAYVSTARHEAARSATLIYNPPGTTHRDHFADGRGSFFTVTISDERLAEAVVEPLHAAAVHLAERRAGGLARALLMECARWTSASELRTEALSLELLSSCVQRPVAAGKMPPSWLRRAMELIADAPTEGLTVGVIARTVGVHPTHLARAFRTFAGCTPGDLLRARRLDSAAARLLETTDPIARVAADCGFGDQAQLTHAFTRTFGIPPAAFRAGKVRHRGMLHFDKTARRRTSTSQA